MLTTLAISCALLTSTQSTAISNAGTLSTITKAGPTVSVYGFVEKQGPIPLFPGMTAQQVLNSAVPLAAAERTDVTYLSRSDWRIQKLGVDTSAATVFVKDGDILFVPSLRSRRIGVAVGDLNRAHIHLIPEVAPSWGKILRDEKLLRGNGRGTAFVLAEGLLSKPNNASFRSFDIKGLDQKEMISGDLLLAAGIPSSDSFWKSLTAFIQNLISKFVAEVVSNLTKIIENSLKASLTSRGAMEGAVAVIGAVDRPSVLKFSPGVSVGQYVNASGSPLPIADPNQLIVVTQNSGPLLASGSSAVSAAARDQIPSPGDIIIVPEITNLPFTAIVGSIKKPVFFRLDKEVKLLDILSLPEASPAGIALKNGRVNDRDGKKMATIYPSLVGNPASVTSAPEVKPLADLMNVVVRPGDVIQVFNSSNEAKVNSTYAAGMIRAVNGFRSGLAAPPRPGASSSP